MYTETKRNSFSSLIAAIECCKTSTEKPDQNILKKKYNANNFANIEHYKILKWTEVVEVESKIRMPCTGVVKRT